MKPIILVIEDNQENLELMVYLLSRYNFEVLVAQDGETGLEIMKREIPDLVICDIQLPKLNGYEIAKSAKADDQLKKIPLIAVTAYAMVGDKDKILSVGFDGYISKPIDPENFIKEIESYLSLQSPSHSSRLKHAKEETQKEYSGKGFVLIVDNSIDNAKLSQTLLESMGFKTKIALSVNKALAILEKEQPFLILSDMHMPKISGLEFLKIVKANDKFRFIPFIFISASNPDENERKECSSVADVKFILRPIEPQLFIKIINEVCASLKVETSKNTESKTYTILVVDDRAINREFLITLLGYSNHHIIEAADGLEALRVTKEKYPDLIITDILMPTMDGYEFIQHVRSDPKIAKTPVIFYTATYKLDEASLLASKCKVEYVLAKPSEPTVILETVNKALGISNDPVSASMMLKFIQPEGASSAINEMGKRISGYLSSIDSTRDILYKIINEVDSLKNERAQLINFTNSLSESLDTIKAVSGRLCALIELSLDLSSERDIEKMFQQFVDGSRKIIGSEYCVLGVLKTNGQRHLKYYFVSTDKSDTIKQDKYPEINVGFIQEILSSKKTIVINDIKKHDMSMLGHPIEKNIVGIPILTPGILYGFLYFSDKANNAEFNQVDVELIENLARNIAIKYENYDLYDIIQRHAAKLQISITEKEKLYNDLMTSEALFRQFAENIDEVFWRTTSNMDKIIYVSPAYEKIWGQPASELYENAHAWFNAIVPEDQPNVKQVFFNAIQTKVNVSIEYRIRRPDGSLRSIYDRRFQLKDNEGNLTGVIGIATDVTEQHKMRSQALLNDKLTTIGTLAAGVAHEINNPIAWILSNLNFLKTKGTELQRDEFNDLVTESIEGAERIHQIVRNLKGFARVDDDQVGEIDIHQVINAAFDMAFPTLKYRARIIKNFDANIPKLQLNSGKLHQIFLNFILNAAQAIPEGNIEKNSINVTTSISGDWLKIDIIDTGSGIPPDVLPRIFDPFFTTKPVGIGSGLGLAICNDIVHGFGGKITVDTIVNQGTTFSIYLPINKQPARVSDKSDVSKTQLVIAAKNLLIIDDEPIFLKSLERMLLGHHKVTTAVGGQAALDCIGSNPEKFDVIISDLSMPDVNGADVYHYVAQKYPGREKYIVFVTGDAYLPSFKKFIANVNNICLEKPFTLDELQGAIRDCLSGQKQKVNH